MWRQLEAVVAVVLNFHVKSGPEWLQSGAGRPSLGQPAWGCGHLATAFAWMSVIFSWSRCSLRSLNADKARPAGLPLACAGPPFHRHYHLTLVIIPGCWIAALDMGLH